MGNQETNENWQGINIKGGEVTINNPVSNYGEKSHKKHKPNLTEQELKELYCHFLQQIL